MTEHTPTDITCNWWLSRDLPCRQERGDRPITLDRTPVKVRAADLHPVWWRGRQWAVTAYGIELLDGGYCIEAKRLVEDIKDWGWPAHMAEKDWVDSDEFATAWLVAWCCTARRRARQRSKRRWHAGDQSHHEVRPAAGKGKPGDGHA